MALAKGSGTYRPTMNGGSTRITRPGARKSMLSKAPGAPGQGWSDSSSDDSRRSDSDDSGSGLVGLAIGLALFSGNTE